jgi:hypothetical protein
MPPETVIVVAALVTAAAAAAGGWLARGSTAVPAAGWAVVGAVLLAVEAWARGRGSLTDPTALVAMRVVVAAVSVCPVMSLLGAKRPQHGVWQAIVATLACVLAMPAVSATLIRPGSMPDLHILERCFLPLLVAVGWMNFAATRHGLAATLVAAGQAGLIWPLLPGVATGAPSLGVDLPAACCLAAGAVVAVVQSACLPAGGRLRQGQTLAAVIDPPLLALRETLGAAWTLRIAERFNALAEARGWPCRLRFAGLELTGDSAGGSWEREAVRCLRSILRRFVSTAWLVRHGGMPSAGKKAAGS